MRVLIVGGGIAGLTLAAKLARQGRQPVVVEKASSYSEEGYSLALYPFGSAVLHGIEAYEELATRAVELRRYEIGSIRGEVIRSVDFASLLGRYGPTYLTSHPALIELLRDTIRGRVDLRMGTTVSALEQAPCEVEVTLSDGSSARFDLVVGCDGVHSFVREMLFGRVPVFDTGWVGWTWWGHEGVFPPETVREHWLRGAFFGVYPTPGRSMFLVAVPTSTAVPEAKYDQAELSAKLRAALGELSESAGVDEALREAGALWPWPLQDVRARHLSKGRVVLCGDAGTAFLPTAGVGASAALRSAAALADELSRADARLVPLAIDRYARRIAKPIRANQRDSRRLARVMFTKGALTSWARDMLIRYVPASAMINSILDAMQQPV